MIFRQKMVGKKCVFVCFIAGSFSYRIASVS